MKTSFITRDHVFVVNLMFFVFFLSLWLCDFVVAQQSIRLGGLFPLTGRLGQSGPQRQSAAKFAVEYINKNRTDLLPNVTLTLLTNDTGTRPDIGLLSAIDQIRQSVVGIVGEASSTVSMTVQAACSAFNVTQISYSSTSPQLSNKDLYPTFVRTAPSDAFQGVAITQIVHFFNWTKIAILSTDDAYGTDLAQTIISESQKLKIDVKTWVTFPAGGTVSDSQFGNLRSSGSKIIILAAVVGDAANALYSASEQQMAGPGTNYTWLLSESAAQAITFRTSDGTINQTIYNAMQGCIGTSPQGGTGPLYEWFLREWQNLNTTLYPGAGTPNPDLYVPFVWDAVMTFAHALSSLIKAGKNYSGLELLKQVKVTSFEGLTGWVSFDSNGDRLLSYNILNLPPGAQQFQVVGTWSMNSGVTLDSPPIWSDNTTNVPSDSLSPVIVFLSPALAALAIAIGGLGFISSFVAVFLLIVWRKTKPIIAMGGLFNTIILSGLLLAFITVILMALEFPTIPPIVYTVFCSIRPWFLGIAYILVFGALWAKTWRIFRIFNNKKLTVVIITNKQLLTFVAILLGIELVILIVWTAWSPVIAILRPTGDMTPFGEPYMAYQCESEQKTIGLIFSIIQICVNAIMMICCLVTVVQIRKVTPRFTEARWLFISVSIRLIMIAFVGLIVIPLSFLLNIHTSLFVQLVGIAFVAWGVLLLLFIPLFYRVYRTLYLGYDDATYGQSDPVRNVISMTTMTSASVDDLAEKNIRIVSHQFSKTLPRELFPKSRKDQVTLLKYKKNWYLHLVPKEGITWWLEELESKYSESEKVHSTEDTAIGRDQNQAQSTPQTEARDFRESEKNDEPEPNDGNNSRSQKQTQPKKTKKKAKRKVKTQSEKQNDSQKKQPDNIMFSDSDGDGDIEYSNPFPQLTTVSASSRRSEQSSGDNDPNNTTEQTQVADV